MEYLQMVAKAPCLPSTWRPEAEPKAIAARLQTSPLSQCVSALFHSLGQQNKYHSQTILLCTRSKHDMC